MRICMILEGSYPYVRGGVSSWMHEYIEAMPEHEFVLWLIGANSKDSGNYKYEIPQNVVEIKEVFLDQTEYIKHRGTPVRRYSRQETDALRELMACGEPAWNVLFRLFHTKKAGALSFLTSGAFLDIFTQLCIDKYPYISFGDLMHTMRSMLMPLLHVIGQEIPEADVYHSTCAGYGGLMGAVASWAQKKPYILTEHGIYTREREEEILRAKWVPHYFKEHWISMFYMIARCSYQSAIKVTSLFARYSSIQGDLGCPSYKRKVIENGIHYERFQHIPLKQADGVIDIGAIVRFHPIKDIKTMLYSFYELKKRMSNVRLHILGGTDDEEYAKECQALIEQLNIEDVIVTGNTDVVQYMEKLDFTILTSISEGQPLSVLESLCARRPCVTTDVGCCRDVLEGNGYDQHGRAGFCEPPMHAQALANSMEFIARNDDIRQMMGEIGRKRILDHFRHPDMIRRYIENYEEVTKQWQALDSN